MPAIVLSSAKHRVGDDMAQYLYRRSPRWVTALALFPDMWLEIIFWILVAGVWFTYAGYGMLVWIWTRLRSRKQRKLSAVSDPLPRIAMIIPAYNEAAILREKIENSLALDYPHGCLQLVVITDGSTDESPRIAADFPQVTHLHVSERRGKAASINRAVQGAERPELLVFTDANTLLNPEALRRLAAHYADDVVGGVSGEKKVLRTGGGIAGEEGAYWRYESALKKLDAELHTLVGAAGELFSMRAALFRPVPESVVLDDFYLSMKICEQGYVVGYEPGAVAMELPSVSLSDERERKTRISAGAFQAMAWLGHLANPFRYGLLSFQFISRRIMRWVFCPLALPMILLLNIVLVARNAAPGWLYAVFLSLQVLGYVLALTGWIRHRSGSRRLGIFSLPFYFIFMNLSVWRGFVRYINGGQSALWDKVARSTTS
jgi:cellulose synthase/poly-beta-1,6-N-acetylglucosamine synthase-like glycosyltransferase